MVRRRIPLGWVPPASEMTDEARQAFRPRWPVECETAFEAQHARLWRTPSHASNTTVTVPANHAALEFQVVQHDARQIRVRSRPAIGGRATGVMLSSKSHRRRLTTTTTWQVASLNSSG